MQLNCKVIKKSQPPPPSITISTPPFQGYPSLSSNIFSTPQVTQFLEDPTKMRVLEGSNYELPTVTSDEG